MKTTVVNVRGKSREDLEADTLFVWVGSAVTGWPDSGLGCPSKPYGTYDVHSVMRDYERDLRAAIAEPDAQRIHPAVHRAAKALPTLKGKRLGCGCAYKMCHATVLAKLADEIEIPA